MKFCTNCDTEQPFLNFFKDKSRQDGHQCWCKACAKKYKAKYKLTASCKSSAIRSKMLWENRNPEKLRVHRLTRYAIKRGDLVPQPCEVCGKERVDAHHPDYDKPMDVMWLCRKHHKDIHRKENEDEHTHERTQARDTGRDSEAR